MYIPNSFRVTDPEKIAKFLQRHSFGTLVTVHEGIPEATHLPLIYRGNAELNVAPSSASAPAARNTLSEADECAANADAGKPINAEPKNDHWGYVWGHVARANSQWLHWVAEREVLAIFTGPHAYISPTWYATQPAVPTWNYAAIHVYGIPEIIDDRDTVIRVLDELTLTYEQGLPQPWDGALPTEYRAKMLAGLVAFRISVTRIEAKFKLGQNRSEVDMQQVYETLRQSSRPSDHDLAELMRQEGWVKS